MALLLERREKPLGRPARDRPIFDPRIHNSFSAVSDESRRREKAEVVAIHHHLVPFRQGLKPFPRPWRERVRGRGGWSRRGRRGETEGSRLVLQSFGDKAELL